MIKLRNIILIFVICTIIYKATSRKQKRKLKEKVRYFGKCLVAALILYWALFIISPLLFRAFT